MKKINLLTVDDNKVQASGLTKLFESSTTINYRGNVPSPEKCMERILQDRLIDIILMDVKFPNSGMNGIQLANELRAKYPFSDKNEKKPSPRIIFFSVETLGFVDIENGIHGLIPKGEDFSSIVSMIEMVYKHKAAFPLEKITKPHIEFWEKLTTSEKKIFRLVLHSKSTLEIAMELNRKPLTITTHRRNILDKIKGSGLKVDRIDDPRIVKLVIKHNLFDIDSLD